jgi:class 3 adenylate cyclase/tetratricopeptide (TPR) repeat protein
MPLCPKCATDNPDIAKFCLACGSPLAEAPPPQEFRKIVTIVFSDLKGSTAMGEKLDSESLREVMTRYFDAMLVELERHGGVVEKFIGDAIMAVFGLPKLHEDDALRAVRAAADMQRVQAELNDELERQWGVRLTVRTGVNTGEVVAGDPTSGQRLVTGDAVNVAARLEQAAGEQEVLLGDLTYRLVRDYVDVEEVEPLELKGKSEPVPAYRLVGVREDAERPRRLDSPMVGRDREFELLSKALAEAVETRRCRLVTLVGEAGVGKSRLIDEFVRSVDSDVSFLRGRCLAYGDGITFWPLAEAIRQASGILERDSTESALQKLSALSGDAEAEARVASAIGLSPTQYSGKELFWGARKLLEALARPGPLLVLFEDVHWAEQTFLELIEHVLETLSDACLLIVCTTRHDLIERRPDWSTSPGATRIELERLTEDETSAVAEHLLGTAGLDERVRSRVVVAADGNPLFVEQLLALLIDEGLIRFENGCWTAGADIDRAVVPPTIQALLAARLDYLDHTERAVIEPASVIGQVFVKGAVSYLLPVNVRDDVGARLGVLTEKQLVHPDVSRSLEEEAFRFHHVLIRDTAYEGILKRARATFHEQFVEWADSVNREGATEYEEINGYHLEQAYTYLAELGPLDDHGRALGADGSRRLASAGRRAFARGDAPAAANLLGRAVALLAENEPARLELLPEYGEALLQVGRFQDAEVTLDDAIAAAGRLGASTVRAHASLVRLLVQLRTGEQERWKEEAAITITEAMAVFEEAGDHSGMAKGWRLLAWTHGVACQFGLAAEAQERALEEARLADDVRQQGRAATAYAVAAVFGPTHVAEAIERCEHMLEQVAGDRHAEGILLGYLGSLLAMNGAFEQARELVVRGRTLLEDLGLQVECALVDMEAWRVETLAEDHVAAERELRRAYDSLSAVGEKFILSTAAGFLAETYYELERFDDVRRLAAEVEELATDDDIGTQAIARCVRGKILGHEGAFDAAIELVQEGLQILAPTDAALLKFDGLLDLAEVSRLAGLEAEARAALEEARDIAELKGSPAMSAVVRGRLSARNGRSLVERTP